MADENLLTPAEVADYLRITKNTVYELIKRGELESIKVGKKIRVEKRALALLKGKSLPESERQQFAAPAHYATGADKDGFIICGQDVLLDVLARYMEKGPDGIRTFRSHMGSYNGLFALYKGEVHTASAHLWDGGSGVYNTNHVKMMLPGLPARVVHLVKRWQGLYVAAGNPKNLRSWPDLTRPDVVLINRERGSGTRVLLDEHIRLMKKDPGRINGYFCEGTSHLEVAAAVARGEADVGLGNEKAAMQVPGIEFIPLQLESYDLVLPLECAGQPTYRRMLEILKREQFRQEIESLGGYHISGMGEIIL